MYNTSTETQKEWFKIQEKKWTVYKHTTPNDKVYIGITSRKPQSRWRENGKGYKNQLFWKAIEKYGWENIKHEIIKENLTEQEAKLLEIELIKQYNSANSDYGYNLTIGGDCTNPETNQKTVYQYDMNGNFIKEWSSLTLASLTLGLLDLSKISACCLNKSKSYGGYIWKYEKSDKVKSVDTKNKNVYQYDLYGNYIRKWDSTMDIKRQLGFDNSGISKCCLKKCRSVNGYIWSYNKFTNEEIQTIKEKQENKDTKRKNKEKNRTKEKRYIYQYALDGSFIRIWKSAGEIERELGYAHTHICKCCNEKLKTAYGYVWRYNYTENLKPTKVNTNKIVYQYSPQKKFIKEWESTRAVERELGINHASISACCNGKKNDDMVNGYIWSYSNNLEQSIS